MTPAQRNNGIWIVNEDTKHRLFFPYKGQRPNQATLERINRALIAEGKQPLPAFQRGPGEIDFDNMAERGPGSEMFNYQQSILGGAMEKIRSLPGSVARAAVPESFREARPAMIMGGAAAGGPLATSVAGPLGFVPGSAAGAAVGSLANELAMWAAGEPGFEPQMATPRLGVLPHTLSMGLSGMGYEVPSVDLPQIDVGPAQRALIEATLEGGMLGSMALARRLGISTWQMLAAVPGAGRRVAYRARLLGIPIGTEAISANPVVAGGWRRTLGKIWWIGRPLRKAEEPVTEAMGEAYLDIGRQIWPWVTAVTEVGGNLSREVLRRNKAMSRIFSRRYESMLNSATKRGAFFPTKPLKDVAKDLVETFYGRDMPKRIVEVAEGVVAEVPISEKTMGFDPRVLNLAKQIMDLKETMSPREMQKMIQSLNKLIRNVKDDDYLAGQAIQLRKGMEEVLDQIQGPAAFVEQFRHLQSQFKSWAELMGRSTAQKIGQATPGIGEVYAKQTRYPSELFDMVWKEKVPEAMVDLRRLVGHRGFREALRTHLETAVDIAEGQRGVVEGRFSIHTLNRLLGLGSPKSPQYKTLQAAFEAADRPGLLKELKGFFDVAEAHFKLDPINTAIFMQRRIVLAGVRGGMRAMMPGASFMPTAGAGAGGAGLISAGGGIGGAFGAAASTGMIIAAALSSYGFSHMLASPRFLRLATEAIDPSVAPNIARAAMGRFMQLYGRELINALGDQARDFIEAKSPVARDIMRTGREAMKGLRGFPGARFEVPEPSQ